MSGSIDTPQGHGRRPLLFISYRSRPPDSQFARELFEHLKSGDEFTPWKTPECVPAGHDFAIHCERAMDDCAALVLVLSRHCHGEQIRGEVEMAIRRGKPIIPIRIEAVEPRDLPGMEKILLLRQWIDAFPEAPREYLPEIVAWLRNQSQSSGPQAPESRAAFHRMGPRVVDQPKSLWRRNRIAVVIALGILIVLLGVALWYFFAPRKQELNPRNGAKAGTNSIAKVITIPKSTVEPKEAIVDRSGASNQAVLLTQLEAEARAKGAARFAARTFQGARRDQTNGSEKLARGDFNGASKDFEAAEPKFQASVERAKAFALRPEGLLVRQSIREQPNVRNLVALAKDRAVGLITRMFKEEFGKEVSPTQSSVWYNNHSDPNINPLGNGETEVEIVYQIEPEFMQLLDSDTAGK